MIKKIKAFTLGEALFAVVVIGVIAAFTIPIVMQDSYGRETILKVKKAYSIMSNAYERAVAKHGSMIDWNEVSTQIYGDRIVNDVSLGVNCQTKNNLTAVNDCIPGCPSLYKAKDKTAVNACTSSNVYKFIAFDGFSYAFQIEDPNCQIDVTGGSTVAPLYLKQVCGTAYTDIFNTQKGKNKNIYGQDLFLFYITRDGIIPTGTDGDKTFPYKEGDCVKSVKTNVFGCTARVLYGKEALFEKEK